jgi:prepilin-type processing-associated H-X9-DG protein
VTQREISTVQTGRSKPDLLKRGGLTLPELLFTIAAVFVLLVLLLPVLAHSRARTKKINCTNHLKQIGFAFCDWAIDHDDKYPMSVSVTNGGTLEHAETGSAALHFQALTNFFPATGKVMGPRRILLCPADPRWTNVSASTPILVVTNVSYFVSLDAKETEPNTFLSGDDNFALHGLPVRHGVLQLWTNSPIEWTSLRHSNQGNIGLADGSVQGASTPRLRSMLCETGLATNRLAIP